MKKFLLLLVLATSLSLSTYANNKPNPTNVVTASDSLMLKQLEDQIRAYDVGDDRIKLTNIKSTINKTEAECSVTFSMEAEASFFGTGVKFGVAVTFTANDCAEAGRKAREGVMAQISNFKALLAQAEQQLSAFLDLIF